MTTREKVRKIRQAAEEKRLVLFVGAGVSANSGYKGWGRLIDRFAEKLGCKKDEYSTNELLRIPQLFFEREADKTEYYRIIQEEFADRECMDNPILDKLLLLEPQHIITTNFDHLIEYALERNHVYGQEHGGQISRYAVVSEDSDLIEISKNQVLLKMHGDVDKPETLVLKESDYLNYSSSHILIENYIKSLLVNHTFLFAGYGLNDYNLKLIMAWVNDIIEKYQGKVERKEHFFLYAGGNTLSGYDKIYYEKRNIYTLEIEDFPKAEQKGNHKRITHEAGKKLYKIVSNLPCSDYAQNTRQIYEKLLCFADCKVITLYDIMEALNLPQKLVSQAEDGVFSGYFVKLMELLAKENPRKDKKKIRYIQETFRKAGIHSVIDMDEDNQEIRLPIGGEKGVSEESLESAREVWAMAKQMDFIDMEKAAGSFRAVTGRDSLKKAGIYFLAGQEAKAKKYLNQAERQCRKADDIVGSGICAMNHFKIEIGAGWEFEKIFNSLSMEKRKSISTLLEYADQFSGLAGKINAELLKAMREFNPYSHTVTHNLTLKNKKIRSLRAELESICRYLTENGVFFYTIGSDCHRTSRWEEIVDSYIELLFHYISPDVRRRLEGEGEVSLEPFDYFLIFQFMEPEELEKKLLKYRISKLGVEKGTAADETILQEAIEGEMAVRKTEDYLCRIAENAVRTLEHFESMRQWPNYPFITKFAEKLVILSERISFSQKAEATILSALGDLYCFMMYEMDDHKFAVINGSMGKIQRYLYQKGKDGCGFPELYERICCFLINEYFRMEKEGLSTEAYVWVLENINTMAYFYEPLEEAYHKRLSEKQTDEFFGSLFEEYGSNLSLFYYENFSMWSPEVKEQIRKQAKRRKRSLQPNEIYMILQKDILPYDDKIEERIHMLFKEAQKAESETAGEKDSGGSIYYIVQKLYREGRIKDQKAFEIYKGKDWWFDFICFPEDFDYGRFQPEGCLWLLEEPYYNIWMNNPSQKEQVRNLLEKAMSEGPTEDIKRVYYKLFG